MSESLTVRIASPREARRDERLRAVTTAFRALPVDRGSRAVVRIAAIRLLVFLGVTIALVAVASLIVLASQDPSLAVGIAVGAGATSVALATRALSWRALAASKDEFRRQLLVQQGAERDLFPSIWQKGHYDYELVAAAIRRLYIDGGLVRAVEHIPADAAEEMDRTVHELSYEPEHAAVFFVRLNGSTYALTPADLERAREREAESVSPRQASPDA